MNSKSNLYILCLATLVSIQSIGQEVTSRDGGYPSDDAYVREHNPTRKVIPYPNLREADVMWSRRMWEVIDLRQKINQPLYLPVDATEARKSLFDVIRIGLLEEGSITAYGLGPAQDDDEFHYALSQDSLESMMNPTKTKYVENPITQELEPKEVIEPLKSSDVMAYKIKEDWIFDKQRSERYVRIIGIAPVINKYVEGSSELKGQVELFWLYYPECRYLFNNYDVFNAHNNSQQMTFDQMFQMRLFQGYIVKEDNVFNRQVSDYALGIDGLLESERIKNDMFIMEHDLWHY